MSLAEIERFHQERVQDFQHIVQSYLEGQMNFHKQMFERLQAAKQSFDS